MGGGGCICLAGCSFWLGGGGGGGVPTFGSCGNPFCIYFPGGGGGGDFLEIFYSRRAKKRLDCYFCSRTISLLSSHFCLTENKFVF